MILQNWWFTTLMGVRSPMCPPLTGKQQCDVLVIGGGAAGLAAALRSAQSGAKTILLERNICGGGTTGKSAGFLTPDSELELHQLLRRFGPTGARHLWGAATSGVEIMRSAIENFSINCDWQQQDSLYVSRDRSTWKDVQDEYHTRKKLDYPATLHPVENLGDSLDSQNYTGGVQYPGTYSVNPLLYAQGIKRGLLGLNVRIYEASTVTRIKEHTVHTDLGSVTAEHILFCSDKPDPQITPFAANVYHAQTFLAVSEPLGDKLVARMFPRGTLQCWDSDMIYTYYRLTGDGRLLVGGGSMLTTFAKSDVTTPSVISGVIDKWRQHFPYLKSVDFIQYWPGRIDMTRDLLPTITREKQRPWIHYVLGCVGLPWASFCGDFVARHALDHERENDKQFYRYFSPKRGFLLPIWLEKIFGKQIIFSMNTAYAKFYQSDKDVQVNASEEDF